MDLTDDQIEDLIALGYDLHIHDGTGYYPGRMTRDKWEASERAKILCIDATQPGDSADRCVAPDCTCRPLIHHAGDCPARFTQE